MESLIDPKYLMLEITTVTKCLLLRIKSLKYFIIKLLQNIVALLSLRANKIIHLFIPELLDLFCDDFIAFRKLYGV